MAASLKTTWDIIRDEEEIEVGDFVWRRDDEDDDEEDEDEEKKMALESSNCEVVF